MFIRGKAFERKEEEAELCSRFIKDGSCVVSSENNTLEMLWRLCSIFFSFP
jgi:hypothetical protein